MNPPPVFPGLLRRCCLLLLPLLALVIGLALLPRARAWDYDGHRLINLLALETLPTNFPAFVLAPEARERVAFLSGEPDRWRSSAEAAFKHATGPDHYFDVDLLPPYRMEAMQLSPFRYEFLAQAMAARVGRPADFPSVDAAKDADRSRALIGLLPWTLAEHEAKLRAAFSCLKEYENAGSPADVANAQATILQVMGVMGHYVGDGSQPLHTTRHHHGWVGENPEGYSTNYSIHAWIDGGYLHQFPVDEPALRRKLRPARLLSSGDPRSATNLFHIAMTYLLDQHRQVAPLYALEKEGKLSGRREKSPEGHEFITVRLVEGAQMLGDLWLTAWHQAPSDMYLRSALMKRKAEAQVPEPDAGPGQRQPKP